MIAWPCVSVPPTDKKDAPSSGEWGEDQRHISELKEQYKKERKGKKNSKLSIPFPFFLLSCVPVHMPVALFKCRKRSYESLECDSA